MSGIKWIYSQHMVDELNLLSYPVIVLTGPTGSGKSTLAEFLTSKYGETISIVKNHTTRPQRSTDNPAHFEYLSCEEFERLKEKGDFFLARYVEYPFYGYLKSELEKNIREKTIPLFMFRYSGLERIISLLNNVYVIDICSDDDRASSMSKDEILVHSVDIVRDVRSRIENICENNGGEKLLRIKNNYDSTFFSNPELTIFIEALTNDRHRFN